MNKPVDFDRSCGRGHWWARQWDYFWNRCSGVVERVFVCLPTVVDTFVRHLDRALGRSYNGLWQRLFMDGHSLVPLLFMLTAILFTVLGPTPRFRGWPAVAGMFAAVALYWLVVRFVLARRAAGRGLLSFQLALVAVLTAIYFWALPAAEALEALPAPYRNMFAPALLLLLTVAAFSHVVAWAVMRGFPDADRRLFAELLKHTELFVVPRPPVPTPRRFLHGLLNAPLYHPLHLLLMPSLPLIVVQAQNVRLVGAVLLVIAWLLLTFTGMYDRLSLMITVVRRWFLVGGQLVVSLIIVALALARVAGIDYVTTLLDSTPGQVILYYVAAAYTAFWLYEYWINRALTERMLPLLRPSRATPGRLGWIEYRIGSDRVSTGVLAKHRAIELYSGGRFAATGAYRDDASGTLCAAWQSYDKTELFARLAAAARALKTWSRDKQYQANVAVAELGKRTKLYFNGMNLLLFAIVVVTMMALHRIPEQPQAVGYRIDAARAARQPVGLTQLVFAGRPPGSRVILLAASGGGTRAALYTASALRGIAALGRLDDVVLVSGVSGGSAALAYFAIHRDELRRQVPGPCTVAELDRIGRGDPEAGDAWCRYIAAMAYPYIEDVLRGASEADIALSKSFGHLLNESFMRSFGVERAQPVALTDIDDLGLILNTTLSGHPAADSSWLGSLYHDDPEAGRRDYSVAAGGRLVFTNLREIGAYPRLAQTLAHAQDEYFRYVIVGGESTSVTAAAALSANFPPVFSNGRVDVLSGPDDAVGRRYWVTDGGAADNRGVISLLYAVHGLLDECERSAACRGAPPELHVIVADASAVAIDYRSDRGGGSILGAANKFASQLMLELFEGARTRYRRLGGRIEPHYLPMPAVLRMRGGLGTHWMMPQTVTLTDICRPSARRAPKVDVARLPLLEMIVNLHPVAPSPGPEEMDCDSQRGSDAAAWLAADRHARAWAEIVAALPARAPRPDQ